jgi:hypothetical protein
MNSLYGETPDPQEWTCPICESNLMDMPLELLAHQLKCKRAKQESKFVNYMNFYLSILYWFINLMTLYE